MAIHSSQPPHVNSLVDRLEPFSTTMMNAPTSPKASEIGSDGPANGDRTNADSSRSAIVRFFDSFLSERNIKWLLGIGALIVAASSLMLVVTHWSQYTPIWKYLIMFGYTAVIAVAGQWTYLRLGLSKTGTMLMSLTLLLMPVLFLALHWVQDAPVSAMSTTESLQRDGPGFMNLVMLAVTSLFAVLMAPRIFKQFLGGDQPTFVVAYLLLCLAGAVIPLIPVAAMPIVGLLCWAVLAVGSMKVNRHVFWLVEENNSPRILGFMPILILGGQFLTLFLLYVAPHVTLPWVGFGCVLVAVPVLTTANAVARVFEMRTGDLVRPLPLPIISPLIVGVLLCLTGIVLSSVDVLTGNGRVNPPFALVPTSATAAAMMCLVARRTGKQAFVWAGLIGVTIAYRFAPIFFSELAAQMVQGSAALVREERLPIAFYGLTFLPLIAGLMTASLLARRNKSTLFATPCRQYSVGLSVLLLLISTLHGKAMMPVAIAMVGVFALQTVFYRNHRYAVCAIASFVMAAFSLPIFLDAAFGFTMSSGAILLCLSAAALVLLFPGHRIDKALSRLATQASSPLEQTSPTQSLIAYCRKASAFLTTLLPLAWLVTHSGIYVEFATPVRDVMWTVPTTAILLLLAVHALRIMNVPLAWVTLSFAYASLIRGGLGLEWGASGVVSVAVVFLAIQWFAGYALRRRPESRLAKTFAEPFEFTSAFGMIMMLVTVVAPSIIGKIMMVPGMLELSPWVMCHALVIAVTFDAARRRNAVMLLGLSYLSAIGLACAVAVAIFGESAWPWLPAIVAGISAVSRLLVATVRYRENPTPNTLTLARSIDGFATAVLLFTAAITLVVFSTPMRFAAAISIASLLFSLDRRDQRSLSLRGALMLANWHGLALLVSWVSGGAIDSILALPQLAGPASLPLAFASAVSICLWQSQIITGNSNVNRALRAHCLLLRLVTLLAIISTAPFDPTMTSLDFIFAGGALVALIVAELMAAVQKQSERQVWHALGLIPIAIGYFAWHGVIGFNSGLSMYIVLAVGIALGVISRIANRYPRLAILARPLRLTANALPMVTVAMGVGRHFLVDSPMWLGMKSLAMLLAGGYYFWMGIERKDRRYTFTAAAILNLALTLLWGELRFTDPQFFLIPIGITILGLVRLLKNELPTKLREPLNYAGALVILVSPVFHIVDGSWVHLFCLMALSVIIVLTAIGLRVRPMVYTGAAFLVADLVAMIIYGSMAETSVLWISGIALGAAVVVLGAFAERNREVLLARLRRVSATIEAWE